MARGMDTPIWDVMLQSAQVINQTMELERRTIQEQQRLELEKQRIDDLQKAREETLAQKERALDYKRMADEAKTQIDAMRANAYAFDVQSRAEDRDYAATQRDQKLEYTKRKDELTKVGANLEAKDATAARGIVDQLWEDSRRLAKFQDPASNQMHATLLGMDDKALAKRDADLAPGAPIDEVINDELMKKYPTVMGIQQKKAEERKVIQAIFQLRDEEYKARSQKALSTVTSPGIKKFLELSLPSNERGDLLFQPPPATTQQAPARAVGAGLRAMAPTPNQAGGQAAVPSDFNAKITPAIDTARKVRLMDTSTPESKKAQVSQAADTLGRVIQSFPAGPERKQALMVISRELIGAGSEATAKELASNAFLRLVDQELTSRGLSAPKGAARASGTMKQE